MTKRYNLNKDGRLGGRPSDNYVSPSQRAVKEYVDVNAYKYMKTLAVTDEGSRAVDVDALYNGAVYTESIIEIRSETGAEITASVMPLYKSIFVLVNTSSSGESVFSFDLTGMDNESINCDHEYLDGFNRVSVTVGAAGARLVEMFTVGTSLSVSVSETDMGVDIKVPDLLAFTAGEGGATVSMATTADTPPSLEYSTDGGRHFTAWESVATRSAERRFTGISLAAGETVMLRGENESLLGSRFVFDGEVSASGKVTSVLDGTDSGTAVPDSGLTGLFDGCASLTSAPSFRGIASVGEEGCAGMFRGCTALTEAPALPAAALGEGCYRGMFEGCSYLGEAPALPAVALATECYARMFKGCVSLGGAPGLPAPALAEGCYMYMFDGCVFDMTDDGETFNFAFGVETWPCTDGTTVFESPVDMALWMGNTAGFTSGSLVFTALASGSTVRVLSVMDDAPVLELSPDGENFRPWNSTLSEGVAHVYDTVTLAHPGDRVYVRGYNPDGVSDYAGEKRTMFQFSGSVSASGDVTALINRNGGMKRAACMAALFCQADRNGALKTAPALPMTTLSEGCYAEMFIGCEGLREAPALPATVLAEDCYYAMFSGCASLQEAPALPATSLAKDCYAMMFAGCGSLAGPPALPATVLREDCYANMFEDCFFDMSDDEGETFNFTFGAGIPYSGEAGEFATCAEAAGWMGNTRGILPNYLTFELEEKKQRSSYYSVDGARQEFYIYNNGAGGEITRDSFGSGEDYGEIETGGNTYLIPLDQAGWNAGMIGHIDETSGEFVGDVTLTRSDIAYLRMITGDSTPPSLEYSADGGQTWTEMRFSQTTIQNLGEVLASEPVVFGSAGDRVMMRGNNPDGFGHIDLQAGRIVLEFFLYNGVFSVSGSVQTIVDETGFGDEAVPMFLLFGSFNEMFEVEVPNGSGFTTPPELPATVLCDGCYSSMFNAQQLLERAPALPAETLAKDCYEGMFSGCGFPMSYDGETFNFRFGAGIPYSDDVAGIYFGDNLEVAVWMDNYKGFIDRYLPDVGPVISEFGEGGYMWTLGSPCVVFDTDGEGCMLYASLLYSRSLSAYGQTTVTVTIGDVVFQGSGGGESADVLLESMEAFVSGLGPRSEEAAPIVDYLDAVSGNGLYVNSVMAIYASGDLQSMPSSGYADISISGARVASIPYVFLASTEEMLSSMKIIAPVAAPPYGLSASGESVCLSRSPLLTYDEGSGKYMLGLDICVSEDFLGESGLTVLVDGDDATGSLTARITDGYIGSFPSGESDDVDAYKEYLGMAEGWILGRVEKEYAGGDLPETVEVSLYMDGEEDEGMAVTTLRIPVPEVTDEEDICLYEVSSGVAEPLNFTMEEGGTVTLNRFGEPYAVSLEYSRDGEIWVAWEEDPDAVLGEDVSGARTVSVPAGGTVYIRNASPYSTPFSEDIMNGSNDCYRFSFSASVSADGDVRSLLCRIPEMGVTSRMCFVTLFSGCTGLTTAPALPATKLASYCYGSMFDGCTSLTVAPALPATTLANGCYAQMFDGCTSLTAAPELPATTLPFDCYFAMFRGCSSLASITCMATDAGAEGCTQDWVARVAANGVFWKNPDAGFWTEGDDGIPEGWVSSSRGSLNFTFPEGGSVILAAHGSPDPISLEYSLDGEETWSAWTETAGVRTAPVPAGGTLHVRNTSLVSAEFNNTPSGQDGDIYMFSFTGDVYASGDARSLLCRSYGDAVLYEGCFSSAFMSCSTLKSAPALPSTTLAEGCYWSMFADCTSLEEAPELPATTLADGCYMGMFSGCTSLQEAPALPATTLAQSCYAMMFAGCTSMEEAPALPAATLVTACYAYMFNDCSSLSAITCLATDISATSCTEGWVDGVASEGVFTRDGYMNGWTTGADGIPEGWDVEIDRADLLNFTMPEGGEVTLSRNGSPAAVNLEYAVDGGDWTDWTEEDGVRTLTLSAGQTVCVRNKSAVSTGFSTGYVDCYAFGFSGSVSASGDARSLLCRKPGDAVLTGWCFCSLFQGCASLTSAPDLPATALASGCYNSMFAGCRSLTAAPELPAATLAAQCYEDMFAGCGSLSSVVCTATDISAVHCTKNWLSGVASAGTFAKSPSVSWTAGADGIPSGWTVEGYECLNFTMPEGGDITLTKYGTPAEVTLEYRVGDSGSWTEWTESENVRTLTLSAGQKVYIRNTSQTGTGFSTSTNDHYQFGFDGGVSAAGSVMSLLSGNPKNVGLSNYCFCGLFGGCSYLTAAPELPAITLANGCYRSMFYNCTSLVSAPALPATTLAQDCYYSMFNVCTSLTAAPVLPATTLASSCYSGMFQGCTALTAAPALPATTLSDACYSGMFADCTSLTAAPALLATRLAYDCYAGMFADCTSLASAPTLPATTLAGYCYYEMFSGCTSLTAAPALPATTLTNYCYYLMFSNCTSLTSAPELPATALAEDCYGNMLSGCTSLTTAPELPATTLAIYCYDGMFYGCTSLTAVPELPATTLVSGCYQSMFQGCTSLTSAPTLPATTLVNYCYKGMFASCSSLNAITCLATDISATQCTHQWLSGVAASGTFTKNLDMSIWTTGANGIPSGWTVYGDYLNFTMPNGGDVALTKYGTPTEVTLEYRVGENGSWATWTESNNVRTLTLSAGQKVYIRNTSVTSTGFSTSLDNRYRFEFNGTVSASGSVMSLLSSNPLNGELSNSCFRALFSGCTSLTSAPALPATTLAEVCYHSMFNGCTSLTSAPALPATTLAEVCYHSMFNGCTSLTSAPELPAMTLANYCYQSMFSGCTTLAAAPALPATTLVAGCYLSMFYGCTSLMAAPSLPATTMANSCYNGMFGGCTALTTAPALPATTLAQYCYKGMFSNCTSLTVAPALPATTLANYCYNQMFYGCMSLTAAPALPATTLADYCYGQMFEGCTLLSSVTCLAINGGNHSTLYWLKNVAAFGMFIKNTAMKNWTIGVDGIPSGWTVYGEYLNFTMPNGGDVTLTKNGTPTEVTLEYRVGESGSWTTWTESNNVRSLTLSAGQTAYIRNTSSTSTGFSTSTSNYYRFGFTGTVSASGSMMSLLSGNPKNVGLSNYCFYELFNGCTSLTSAPALPATTLAEGCYIRMFSGCTSLTSAPVLPSTILASGCYNSMFQGCTSLTSTPVLPATTLAEGCYIGMFSGCTSLTSAPVLPSTTLATYCYRFMFRNCTSLASAPTLPATTLAQYCYNAMFYGCTLLSSVTCMATNISATDCTTNWLSGVAASGTFTKNPDMSNWTTGANGIPSGWTVQDAQV